MVTPLWCFLLLSISMQLSASITTRTVHIDGKKIKPKDRLALHRKISQELEFSKYYGNSLENLQDFLSTDFRGPSVIKVSNLQTLKFRLGTNYVEQFIEALRVASKENQKVIILIEQGT